jgi:hypothetical protein
MIAAIPIVFSRTDTANHTQFVEARVGGHRLGVAEELSTVASMLPISALSPDLYHRSIDVEFTNDRRIP